MDPFYITTPIYYVNGLPHIGHAYTTIAADAITRWHRLKGREVFFLTGTDEHGQKVLEKARERGMTPIQHCDDMVVHWKAMFEKLGIQYSRFIRTTDADHVSAVQAVLQTLWDGGHIYRSTYEGWYHVADEIFVTEKDIEEGRYQRSDLQRISEANYFFRMSAWQEQLIQHIEKNPDYIQPVSRKNEVLGFLRKPLGDLCISRPKARMSWGIEIPFDAEYVTYVWFDALLNYLTGIGYRPGGGDEFRKWWPVDYHLIGKDILTTHAVYWSTMLLAMGVELPTTLFAHGWWTNAEGEKLSKSKGNAIDIGLLADEFGVDAARYFFLREITFGVDGQFSYDGFLTRYNADLANDLGNLGHRGLSMTKNWLGGVVPGPDASTAADQELRRIGAKAVVAFDDAMNKLQFNRALEGLWDLVRAGNKYIDTEQPWGLNKKGDTVRLATVKRHVLEACYVAATLLLPILPHKAPELLRRLGRTEDDARAFLPRLLAEAREGELSFSGLATGAPIDVSDPLFPRFRELPPKIAALFEAPAGVVPAPEPPKSEPTDAITYDDFAKVKLRAGKIVAAERHPKADKLLVLTVDVGEPKPRTIVAGIAGKFSPDQVVGRSVVVVVNLAPASLRGVTSEGMLLAAGGKDVIDLVSVDAAPGEIIR
jgi:methionyl-tRNA synthetase